MLLCCRVGLLLVICFFFAVNNVSSFAELILHSDLNSSAVFPTVMIGSGVALAARGLCVHCQRLRSGSVEVRQLECIQSLLEEGTGLSDKTKNRSLGSEFETDTQTVLPL